MAAAPAGDEDSEAPTADGARERIGEESKKGDEGGLTALVSVSKSVIRAVTGRRAARLAAIAGGLVV